MTTAPRIRVLVVDDSAFARKVLREALSQEPSIDVIGTARDGLEALERIAELQPDVVTLDLMMPNLDGLGVLRALPPGGPRVVLVTTTDSTSDLAIEALAAGAIDFVHKPTSLATERLTELAGELRQKVLVAGQAAARRFTPVPAAPTGRAIVPSEGKVRALLIGTSTGGPQALSRLIPALPADLPVPVAVALHIPAGYTGALSRRLDEASKLHVVEASDEGVAFVPGVVVVARGGSHLAISRRGTATSAVIDRSPVGEAFTPSVDHLFRSAVAVFGGGTLGVVLTGMGNDGLEGAREIRRAGGTVLVESAETCVVYGMPRVIKDAGLATEEAPLLLVVERILTYL